MVVVTRREGLKASRAPGPYPNSVSGARSRFHVPDLVLRMGVCAAAVVEVLVLNDILGAQTPASNSSGTYNLLTWLTAIYNANNSNSWDSKPQGV